MSSVIQKKISLRKTRKTNKRAGDFDIQSFNGKEGWFYSDIVKDHFLRPKNFWKKNDEKIKWNGMGMIGSPACGDVMRFWIYIDSNGGKIKKCRWQTFGCASAIASTSMLSVMITENDGMKIDKALKIKARDIIKRLGGLPARKIHCSVLGDKALRSAINDYFRRTEQYDRIESEGAKIIDKVLKITDKDIEEAVKGGARTLKEVQEITKVGLGDRSCITEADQLVRFYVEKYN